MAKYSKGAQEKVKKVMEERKRGTLRSGRSGKKVTGHCYRSFGSAQEWRQSPEKETCLKKLKIPTRTE